MKPIEEIEDDKAGIDYNLMLEKANISFTILLGSTAKAQQHLKALQAFGESTPFEFPDLIKASQRMQAMGFAADKVIPSLRSIGDVVSAVGGGKEELDGVVLALGQMQTKGKVSAEEMNQLAERGIPAWDLLTKAIGKTKEETIKLSEQGRLSGGRAVEGIVAMMGERFGGQMDKMIDYIADANDIELPKTITDPDARICDVFVALRYFAANYCLMPGVEMEDNQQMVREAMTAAVEAAAASLGVDIRGEQ